MKLFDLLDRIDSWIYEHEHKKEPQHAEGGIACLKGPPTVLQPVDGNVIAGAGFAGSGPPMHGAGFAGGGVAWNPASPIAHKTDFDNDGIPDNIDQHHGPGAHGGGNVPWNPASPIAHKTDFDNDGIPDNLDQHHGPGAHQGGNLPWDPQSPIAHKTDFDQDGISDDIDQEYGEGGFDPDPQ